MLKQAFLYKALFSRSPKWLILALHVVLVCFMIFPGTMFAVICKQERSVCYLLRLSKSQSIIQLGDSTQSKQIRKMYFNASFIKSIIISIYSLTISTISSHSFLLVIIFNQWHKKKSSKKDSMAIGSFQKNVVNAWSTAATSHRAQICWLVLYSEERIHPSATTAAHLWGNTFISVRNHIFLQKISLFPDSSTAGHRHVQRTLGPHWGGVGI